MTELFKIMNNLASPIMNMFTPSVKIFQEFATQRKKTVKCYLETVSYFCPYF